MTQQEKILDILKKNQGQWVCGQIFNDPPLRISQFHTRIFELKKRGYGIEASEFSNEWGFKSYRLISEPLTFTGKCCASFEIFGTHSQECLKEKVTMKGLF